MIKSFKGGEGFTLSHYVKFFTKDITFNPHQYARSRADQHRRLSGCWFLPRLPGHTGAALRSQEAPQTGLLMPLIAPPYLFAISLIILFGHNES